MVVEEQLAMNQLERDFLHVHKSAQAYAHIFPPKARPSYDLSSRQYISVTRDR